MAKQPETSIVDETKDTAPQKLQVAAPNGDLVKVTITKFGAGLVSTGERDEMGDVYAKRGDTMMVSKSVANSLEVRGLAEAD